MKFSAPSNWPTQKIAMEASPKNHTHAFAGPGNRSHRAERRVLRPATQGRAVAYEERRDQDQKRHERDPERHHVEMRERHVLRAHLNGQKVIAEGREWRRGEHEKHHDRAVHGHQLQVVLRRHHAAGRAVLGEHLQAGNRGIGPAKVDAHEPGKHHAGKRRDQGQSVILLADHLVVQAENVFSDEARRGRVMLRRVGRTHRA